MILHALGWGLVVISGLMLGAGTILLLFRVFDWIDEILPHENLYRAVITLLVFALGIVLISL